MVGLVLLAWLLLAGLPFGRDDSKPRVAAPPTDTVAEAEPPPESTTLIEVPAGAADDSFEISTTTTQAPPLAPAPVPTATVTPTPTATAPPPRAPVQRPPVVVVEQPRPQPQQPRPQPQPQQPEQPRAQPAPPVRVMPRPTAEISASEAEDTLRNYVRSTRYYEVASECIRVENRGYRNVGYDLEVWHSCAGGGASRLLGRWRVDSKTREVFRQRDDGRYLRP